MDEITERWKTILAGIVLIVVAVVLSGVMGHRDYEAGDTEKVTLGKEVKANDSLPLGGSH